MATPGLTRVGNGYYADPSITSQSFEHVHTPHMNTKYTRYALPIIAMLAMSDLPRVGASGSGGPVSWFVWMGCMAICLAASSRGFSYQCAAMCAKPHEVLAIAGL